MGSYNSKFVVEKEEQIRHLKPTSPQWLYTHAESCGMTFAEVLRCWRRFAMLGPNPSGILTKESSIWKSEDKFIQKLLRQLPWDRKMQLSFQTYCNVIDWFQNIDLLTKLKVVFGVLNNGQPLTSNLLFSILKNVYPDKTVNEQNQLAKNFVVQADVAHQGYVDEEHFIEFAQRIPIDEFQSMLDFVVIPKDLQTANATESDD